MTNLLRTYLGLDDPEPEPEPEPEPQVAKEATPTRKLVSAHKHKEDKKNGND